MYLKSLPAKCEPSCQPQYVQMFIEEFDLFPAPTYGCSSVTSSSSGLIQFNSLVFVDTFHTSNHNELHLTLILKPSPQPGKLWKQQPGSRLTLSTLCSWVNLHKLITHATPSSLVRLYKWLTYSTQRYFCQPPQNDSYQSRNSLYKDVTVRWLSHLYNLEIPILVGWHLHETVLWSAFVKCPSMWRYLPFYTVYAIWDFANLAMLNLP